LLTELVASSMVKERASFL